MVDGVCLKTGQPVLFPVAEENRRGPEPALTQPPLTVEQFVREIALRLKTVIRISAQVKVTKMVDVLLK